MSSGAGQAEAEAQARRVRYRILAAGYDVLTREGYPAFTLGRLAACAEVTDQQVVDVVGDRRAALKACYDVALAGDDAAVSIRDRPQFKALFVATDAVVFLNAYALWMCLTHERTGPVVSAILTTDAPDADSAAFLATVERERRVGTSSAISRMQEMAWLQGWISLDEAIDIVWCLAAPETYHRLVVVRGWSLQAYEQWLAGQLRAALLHR